MTPQQRADKIATKYMYLPSGMANDIAEAIRDAVAEQFNANDERMAASLKRQIDLRQEVDGLQKLYNAACTELEPARLALSGNGSDVTTRENLGDAFRTLPVFESHIKRWKDAASAHDEARKEAGL